MSTVVHFVDVGQGNMTLLQLANGTIFLYDCNVTEDNEDRVLGYLGEKIGWGRSINVFVNSHRDADHMRGVQKIHQYFPIKHIWDSGVAGTTPNSTEYREYMGLRRQVGFTEIERLKRWDYGATRLRVMNARNDDLPDDPNAQSIVIKVVHQDTRNNELGSVILTGDTNAVTWQSIQQHYSNGDLSCSILLGSHHGSITFFDDPSNDRHYYTGHIRAMSPAMTIISVGDNVHGHPDEKAIELYKKYSHGSDKGNKLYRTDEQGHMRVELKDDGGWTLTKEK